MVWYVYTDNVCPVIAVAKHNTVFRKDFSLLIFTIEVTCYEISKIIYELFSRIRNNYYFRKVVYVLAITDFSK